MTDLDVDAVRARELLEEADRLAIDQTQTLIDAYDKVAAEALDVEVFAEALEALDRKATLVAALHHLRLTAARRLQGNPEGDDKNDGFPFGMPDLDLPEGDDESLDRDLG